jgi:hypothetical protein
MSSHNQQSNSRQFSTNATAALTPLERVLDCEQPEGERVPIRVLERTGDRADEHEIEAIPGSPTVNAVSDGYPADDSVIAVAFERGLERHIPGWHDLSADELATRVDEADVTTYSYTESRLESIGEDWEPPGGDGRSSGRRERDAIFGDHDEAIERFCRDARRAFTEPAAAADGLAGMLSVEDRAFASVVNAEAVLEDLASPGEPGVTPRGTETPPETRGECAGTRDDRYRPENDDALACWECSTRPHNRPEKFERDDPAGPECAAQATPEWELRGAVARHVDLSDLPDAVREAYAGDPRRLLRALAALRSGDDDRIRKAALRLAYRPHLDDVEEYNYNRALALLRDHGVAAGLPIIGEGGER